MKEARSFSPPHHSFPSPSLSSSSSSPYVPLPSSCSAVSLRERRGAIPLQPLRTVSSSSPPRTKTNWGIEFVFDTVSLAKQCEVAESLSQLASLWMVVHSHLESTPASSASSSSSAATTAAAATAAGGREGGGEKGSSSAGKNRPFWDEEFQEYEKRGWQRSVLAPVEHIRTADMARELRRWKVRQVDR